MNSKVFWFGTIFLIIVIGVFSFLNSAKSEISNAPSKGLETCKSLVYSGEDRIDLLFISTEDEAKEYTELLFETEPFKEYKNYFNINLIEANPECELYKGIAILCANKEVQTLARSCEHDYTIVIKDEQSQIRSSSYHNVISLNKNVEESVLIHELGHGIQGLAEEYQASGLPRGQENCQKSCNSFGYLADSCTQECTESSLYRSIDQGVMRTLSTTDYGRYDTELIKKTLNKNEPKDVKITGNQIQDSLGCSEQSATEIELTQKDGLTEATSTNKIVQGCAPNKSGNGETCIGRLCYTIEGIFTDTQQPQDATLSGEFLPPPETTTILVPSDTAEILITQNGQLITTINTAQAGATACKIN